MIRTLHESSEESGGMHDPQEMVSALLDGELSGQEVDALLKALDDDAALCESVRGSCRWTATAAVLRGGGGSPLAGVDVSAGVRAAIAAEQDAAQRQGKVVPLMRGRRRVARGRWVLPGAGLAAAASLLAAAVLLMPLRAGYDGSPLWMAGGEPVPTAAGPDVQLASLGDAVVDDATSGESDARAQREEQLNTYYIEFAGYRSAQGVGGPLGFARYAAHNAPGASRSPGGVSAVRNADLRAMPQR